MAALCGAPTTLGKHILINISELTDSRDSRTSLVAISYQF
jgi:hypothetical protein